MRFIYFLVGTAFASTQIDKVRTELPRLIDLMKVNLVYSVQHYDKVYTELYMEKYEEKCTELLNSCDESCDPTELGQLTSRFEDSYATAQEFLAARDQLGISKIESDKKLIMRIATENFENFMRYAQEHIARNPRQGPAPNVEQALDIFKVAISNYELRVDVALIQLPQSLQRNPIVQHLYKELFQSLKKPLESLVKGVEELNFNQYVVPAVST